MWKVGFEAGDALSPVALWLVCAAGGGEGLRELSDVEREREPEGVMAGAALTAAAGGEEGLREGVL
jgi:hypothetical protein